MIDTGIFNSSNFRDGDQYFVRIDKQLKADRLYGSAFWTNLNYGGPAVIPQFSTTNHNTQQALQINYTHIFSSSTLNEAIFAQNRIEGFIGETGDFTIPSISVTGQSVGYGVGFAQGDFIQHNYHWRDVLTHVRGTHVLKFGYEGWFGDDVEPFQGPWSQPKFSFDNLLTLAQDAPLNEGGVMYDPMAGQQKLWEWNAASRTWGAFAQDTWTARRNLTLTLGFRYDDQGNPYSRTDTTVFGNFYLGSGSSFQEQVANGVARPTKNALKNSPKAFNPRAGVAWDVAGERRVGRARRGGRVRQLADVGQRAGRVPGQPAGPDPADLLRRIVHAADLQPGQRQHAAVRVHVPEPGGLGALSHGSLSRRQQAASRAPPRRLAGSIPT